MLPGDQNSKDIAFWQESIASQLPQKDAEEFIAALKKGPEKESEQVFSRMALWQIEDPIYGLSNIRSVKRDKQLREFCSKLADLYRREASGETVSPEAFAALYANMEPVWAHAGIRWKHIVGFLSHRFGVVGKGIADYLDRGWSEGWIWATAAARKRGMGQTSVLVWSWARAESGEKPSASYDKRMIALRDRFLETIRV